MSKQRTSSLLIYGRLLAAQSVLDGIPRQLIGTVANKAIADAGFAINRALAEVAAPTTPPRRSKGGAA